MGTFKRVTINLPDDQVQFVQSVADREGIAAVDVIRRAISSEKFFDKSERDGAKILLEQDGKLREVIRR